MEYHVRDFGALVKDAEVFAKISRNNATSTNLPLTKTNQARADSIQHRDRLGPIQGLFYNHGGPTLTLKAPSGARLRSQLLRVRCVSAHLPGRAMGCRPPQERAWG